MRLSSSVQIAKSLLPQDTALQSASGNSPLASPADHTHGVKIRRASLPVDANGEVLWTFATPFSVKPVMSFAVENVVGLQPLVVDVVECDEMHVKLKVRRARTLPAVLPLLTALISFDIFGGTAPVGTTIHLFAGEPTG